MGGVDRPLGDFFRIGRGGTSYPIGGISVMPLVDNEKPGLVWIEEQAIRLSNPPTKVEADGRAYVDGGPRSAFVIELGKQVRSVSAVPWGVSWDPASPHYMDQARLVSERKFKANRFTEADILAHATTRKQLSLSLAVDVPDTIRSEEQR